MTRRRLAFRIVLGLVVAMLVGSALIVTQPTFSRRGGASPLAADPARLRRHVEVLAQGLVPRGLDHPENLEKAAAYVEAELRAAGLAVSSQPFTVAGVRVRNVLAEAGPDSPELLVVGAHYDAFGGLPGADDNASGTAGLLELARLMAIAPPAGRVELVAYTLEEPPVFGSPLMGSAVHAASCRQRGVRVSAMLGLEMIGDFSDAPGSQTYPVPAMRLLYPSRGDFVAVAGRLREIGLVRRVKSAMRRVPELPVRSINAPPAFGGIDLSDHASYWKEGIPAVMVTDTAFFRNARYHTEEDTPDRLDYRRMALVVSALHQAVLALAGH